MTTLPHPSRVLVPIGFLLACLPFALADDSAGGTYRNLQIQGDVMARGGELLIKSKSATVVVGEGGLDNYRLSAEVVLGPKGLPLVVQVMPKDAADLKKPAAARVVISRDTIGRNLAVSSQHFDEQGKGWTPSKDIVNYPYWPADTNKAGLKAVADMKPRTWHDRRLRLRVDVGPKKIAVWFEGLLFHEFDRPEGAKGPVALQLAADDRLCSAVAEKWVPNPLYLPVDITSQANDRFERGGDRLSFLSGGVPFELCPAANNQINLRPSGWIEAGRDPSSYYEYYDAGGFILHDPRMPMLRVPVADYRVAHVLAVADDGEELTNALTIQAGRYGYANQVVQYDFFGTIPRRSQKDFDGVGIVLTDLGRLYHVRVPLDTVFAQDVERTIEMFLTKEIRLARRKPDPNRFRHRPLGLPSGVRIAAITLERSPLQMRVTSKESGHAFVEPQAPEFQIRLENIAPAAQTYTLTFAATHLDGTKSQVQRTGRVEPGKTVELSVPVPVKKRGYHDLTVTLLDGKKQALHRRTSFAVLPPDTRKHRDTSPFGTWDFSGGHFTSSDADQVGPLYVKLGLRYGMFGFTPEERKKYGVVIGPEPVISNQGLEGYEKFLARSPDTPPVGLIFHEHSISGRHVTRVPDLFHDFPRYKLNDIEEQQFKKLWDSAVTSAKAVRAKYPNVHLRLGNGPLPTREEFYRRKFPAELFDSAGNETGSFGRPPEAQPPDCIANNASLWMDRQMLDAYGYKDKPVTQCFEICYPATNPGNVSLRTQSDYLVRHALHALAWGIKEFRPGCISDMGNSYYYSNWGATGFCNRKPELNVKPSFVAFATLTRVLDGAKFVRVVPMGSASVYGMEFDRPDGSQVYALWTLRGRRPVTLTFADGGPWQRIDDQGNETALKQALRWVKVTLGPSPIYVAGKGRLAEVEPGLPEYDDRPVGQATDDRPASMATLAALDSLDGWTLEEGRNPELEFYNFMTPRRKGDFAFKPVDLFEGRGNVLCVTPRPIKHGKDTMPMYAVLAHKKGIPVPGTPTDIGLWVNGNSGWGRFIFELTDASGQRWISLGAQQTGDVSTWLSDMVPKELLEKFPTPGISDWNTEDVFGTSKINFDGWRYLSFPLPGNYPGEKYPWPANSQWRWDKDGVVHYPLTFRKLIVELPEKVLHVKTWAPVERPAIYLRDLTVGQGDVVRLKKTSHERNEE